LIRDLIAEGRQAEGRELAASAAGHGDEPRKLMALIARKRADRCGECRKPIAAGEPVWIGPVGYAGYSVWNHVLAPLCAKCRHEEWMYKRIAFPDAPSPCAACGRPVYVHTSGRRRKWVLCSDACRRAKYRALYFASKGSRKATCPVCGEPFTQRRSDAVTCGPACRQKAYRRRVTDAKRARVPVSQP
jgi:hypothetical protein